ncbi:MAG: hypothetical protein U9Q92_04005 [archaeon]|nr:hypothetical protein [archaeon]
MERRLIFGILVMLLIIPYVNAECGVYDDFSSGTLDSNKWYEVIATDRGTGMVDEHYVEDGVYHTAQVNMRDGGTGLVVKNLVFKSGDTIEYDVNYISGEGNRQSTMILNGNAYRWVFLGYWNEIAGNNDYGVHHIKLTFLSEGVYGELTRPNGDIDTHLWDEYPAEEYTFGIVTRTGHNGLVHMDYDNVEICGFVEDNNAEVPEFPMPILAVMISLLGFTFLRPQIGPKSL